MPLLNDLEVGEVYFTSPASLCIQLTCGASFDQPNNHSEGLKFILFQCFSIILFLVGSTLVHFHKMLSRENSHTYRRLSQVCQFVIYASVVNSILFNLFHVLQKVLFKANKSYLGITTWSKCVFFQVYWSLNSAV